MKRLHNIHKSKKLLRVSLEYDEVNDAVQSIKITGDFFIYPEESLDKLESSLVGARLERDPIKQKIDLWLRDSEVYGFDSVSLTEAILRSVERDELQV
ncbi:MAG: lipoate protein ligase C-terminal domain-containing protein [Nitrososphaerales archaeon]